ncbi:MAG: DUF1501 domain-containing protein [Planctomycetaceae bacterium]
MFAFADRWAGILDRVSRREALAIGGLSLAAGTGALKPASANDAAAPTTAKSLIFLALYGGPPHQDTFDLKPNAPAEVRGEFEPIDTSLPGFQICEYLPKLARLAHQYTVIRSMTHGDNAHESAFYALMTGRPHPQPNTNARVSPNDFPCYGSAMTYVRPPQHAVPGYVVTGGLLAKRSGQLAGIIGPSWSPYVIRGDADEPDFRAPEFTLPADVSVSRLQRRHDLVEQFGARIAAGRESDVTSFPSYQQRAFDMLTSPQMTRAFDIASESPATRAAYGHHPFGQNLLLCRRLAEAGVPIVQVNWRNRGDGAFDTHSDNFNACKGQLLPNFDACLSALLTDLEDRGLLDQTLVVAAGEFGRTPAINANAGRDHWGGCNSILLAGGGIKRGYVHGSSDRTAAYPATGPVGPWDLYATILHCCGINPETTLHDTQHRPHKLCEGTVIADVLERG